MLDSTDAEEAKPVGAKGAKTRNSPTDQEVYFKRPRAKPFIDMKFVEFAELYRWTLRGKDEKEPVQNDAEEVHSAQLHDGRRIFLHKRSSRAVRRIDVLQPRAGESFYFRELLVRFSAVSAKDLQRMSALMLGTGELSFKKGVKELGARALQPYLRVNDQITSLKFEEGDLGDAGLRILVDACENNGSLTSLACMKDNGITGKIVDQHPYYTI